ncbi:oxygenase MpaB family protein [Mycobacterium sp. PDNC021]|uniref:oxygenase MpaB family protein n=1 Tax=Mycobacterium sp. PDNC021 TaxID=3391399 RepID=UPI003AABF47F
MTEVDVPKAASNPGADESADDHLLTDTPITKNVIYGPAYVPRLEGDDSLPRRQQHPIPVPANSLLWKYFGEYSVMLAGVANAGLLQSLFPQVAQGVSEHSQLLNSKDYRDIFQRIINTQVGITKVMYSSPEVAKTYGIQLRNYHKSVKGDMPNGRTYHALNAETWYFTHATFFMTIMEASDAGLFRKPLTWAEKEQIFEESKAWYSLMGVDDRAQPETYADFEKYWEKTLKTQMFASKMSDYNFVLVRGGNFDKLVAPRLRPAMRRAAPLIRRMMRLIFVAPLKPELRDALRVNDVYSPIDAMIFRAIMRVQRWVRQGMIIARVPLKYRYMPVAVEAFERAGIHPDDITLESAREALRQARAEASGARSLSTVAGAEMAPEGAVCAKCQRELEVCADCQGTGQANGDVCDVCDGAGRGCKVHHNNWREPGRGNGVGLEDDFSVTD